MKEHPTIAEIRRIRRAIAAEYDYKPQGILEMLKTRQKERLLTKNKIPIYSNSDSEVQLSSSRK
jgi:hypothetical protein